MRIPESGQSTSNSLLSLSNAKRAREGKKSPGRRGERKGKEEKQAAPRTHGRCTNTKARFFSTSTFIAILRGASFGRRNEKKKKGLRRFAWPQTETDRAERISSEALVEILRGTVLPLLSVLLAPSFCYREKCC